MKPSTLVCVNGNDGQLPQIELFISTLRNPDQGDYKGDICVLSTGLSRPVKDYLDNIAFTHIDPLDRLYEHPLARRLGLFTYVCETCQMAMGKVDKKCPETDIGDKSRLFCAAALSVFRQALEKGKDNELWEKHGRERFSIYRNKHFSKLGLLSFLERHPNRYDKILLCDGDMIFQRPIDDLLDNVTDDRVYIANEVNSILPGTNIYRSNKLADRFPDYASRLQYGPNAHELNVGVLLGKGKTINSLLKAWEKLMLDSGLESLFYDHPSDFWHEQDFMRLYRDMHQGTFSDLGPDELVHVCSLGHTLIQENKGVFKLRNRDEIYPRIVHFAGGTWKKYPTVRIAYQRTNESILKFKT